MSALNSISDKFYMSARGSDALRDAALDSANNPTYTTAPRIDPLQTVRQIVQPNQESANQPSVSAEQNKAAQQRDKLTSKAPGGVGAALGAGASAEAGAARQQTAQKEATNLATNVAKLDKVIVGEQPKEPAGGNKLAGAAMGQGLNMAAAAAATVVAGPVAGAAVAAAGLAYDVAAVFSGRSGGGSSFASRADSPGYTSSAPSAQPAQSSVSAAFMQNMMNIPGGGRRLDAGSIETTSAGLRGIEKAPPLAMSAAAVLLAGVYKNGSSQGDDPKADKDNKLSFEPMAALKPNPGVFVAAAPKPFFG